MKEYDVKIRETLEMTVMVETENADRFLFRWVNFRKTELSEYHRTGKHRQMTAFGTC